jgi:uncharacterized membrane protein YhaH (DUF805 family)
MNEYIGVLKQYAVFTGRSNRKEYWTFLIVNIIVAFLIGLILGFIDSMINTNISWLAQIYSLAVLLPSIGVTIRRMHDTDHSGWWSIVPLVNIIFALTAGTPGENKYGPVPGDMAASANAM